MDWTLIEAKVNRDFLSRNTETDDDIVRSSLYHYESHVRPLTADMDYTFCVRTSTLHRVKAVASYHGVTVDALLSRCLAIYLRYHSGT